MNAPDVREGIAERAAKIQAVAELLAQRDGAVGMAALVIHDLAAEVEALAQKTTKSAAAALMDAVTPICVSVADACRTLGVGRTTLYRLAKDGELRFVKLGARSLVPMQDLRAVIARRLSRA